MTGLFTTAFLAANKTIGHEIRWTIKVGLTHVRTPRQHHQKPLPNAASFWSCRSVSKSDVNNAPINIVRAALAAITVMSEPCSSLCLEDFWPLSCTVVDGEDHDAVLIDGVGCDKRRIRDDQLTSTRNPA